jgi:hypothetical protein
MERKGRGRRISGFSGDEHGVVDLTRFWYGQAGGQAGERARSKRCVEDLTIHPSIALFWMPSLSWESVGGITYG